MGALRTSSYLISVKLEDEKDKYMLIHGYTGAIDVVSEELLNKIKTVSAFSNFSDSMLKTLLNRGYITKKTCQEERKFVELLAKELGKVQKITKKDFTLLVTYNCNFRCPYCYELNNLKEHKSLLISEKMCDMAFKVISQIEPNSCLQGKNVTLFGGEPLLEENRERIEYIVNEGKKYGFKFSVITNGYDLDKYVDLLSKDSISELQITIDGCKEVHDERRPHASKLATFDKIMCNVVLALGRNVNVIIRINVDNTNINEVKKINDYLNDLKLYSYRNLKVYTAYIGGESNSNPIEYNMKINLSENYNEFFNLFTEPTFKIHHNYSIYKRLAYAIKNKKTIPLTSFHCEALHSNYVLDPLGNIYKCLELVGNEKNAVGKYNKGVVEWNDNVKLWDSRDVNNLDSCVKCKYALLCSGGCFSRTIQGTRTSCGDFSIILKKVCNEIYRKNEPLFINF